jgi:bifunctional non-homologous end joining protein LigD
MPTKKKRAAQDVHSANKRQVPTFVAPMAAVSVEALPEGPEWSYELKLDGYRALIIKDGTSIQIRSRNDKDLMGMYPAVAASARRLEVDQVIIDGEIVAVDQQGRPSFQALQHRGSHPNHAIVFYAFDLLHLNGEDTRGVWNALHQKNKGIAHLQTNEESPSCPVAVRSHETRKYRAIPGNRGGRCAGDGRAD